MISGLVISIGGLQDSLRKVSLSALLDYLQGKEAKDGELSLASDILWVLQNYKRCDRVTVPTLKVLGGLGCSKNDGYILVYVSVGMVNLLSELCKSIF